MNYRTFFWIVGFVSPVAIAVAISIQLQRERVSLEAMIAQLSASALQIESSLQETTKHLQDINHESDSIKADLKKRESTLSPAQKRSIAVLQAAARLAAEGRPSVKDSSLLLDQPSATQLYFSQLLSDPAYHDAVSALAKQEVEGKYGRLFAAMALNPTDQDQLEDLLAQRQMAKDDAKSLVLGGLNQANSAAADSPAVQAEITAADSDTVKAIDADIQKTFGKQVWHEVSAYDGVAQFYATMDEMSARLNYTSTPLQPVQADQVVGLLVQALGPKVYNSNWTVPESVIAQAATVLSAPQIGVLQQIQQEQAKRVQTRNILQSESNQP
jgi:hypothetical protein